MLVGINLLYCYKSKETRNTEDSDIEIIDKDFNPYFWLATITYAKSRDSTLIISMSESSVFLFPYLFVEIDPSHILNF